MFWYETLAALLFQEGYVSACFDPCVFINSKKQVYLAIYVDDILIFGPDNSTTTELEKTLHSEFECTDLSIAHYILGIQVDINGQGISLNQSSYIDKILERFGMTGCKLVGTPQDPGIQLQKGSPESELSDKTLYQSIIRSLMYACIGTRPDLAHSVTLLSQFSSCPNQTHLAAAKRVLRYLKGSLEWK